MSFNWKGLIRPALNILGGYVFGIVVGPLILLVLKVSKIVSVGWNDLLLLVGGVLLRFVFVISRERR